MLITLCHQNLLFENPVREEKIENSFLIELFILNASIIRLLLSQYEENRRVIVHCIL